MFFLTPFVRLCRSIWFSLWKLEKNEGEMTLLTFEIVSLLVLAVTVPYILWHKKRALDGF